MDGTNWRSALGAAVLAAPLFFAACGGGGGDSAGTASGGTGTLALSISDASTEDWATIGVKILGVALVPRGGGPPVNVYTAPSPTPVTNLVQLDDLSEILDTASIPAGTYTGAVLTLAGNPGDVTLVVSAQPESGFTATPGSTIPSDHIQIQRATGLAGHKTVTVNVAFGAPVTVGASQTTPLDLEFDLSHPAFLVEHVPPSGTSIWSVNFHGPVRHHPVRDLARLVLRHSYGTATGVAADGSSLSFYRDFPLLPVTTPETAITSSRTLQVLADASNGTLVYDLDGGTRSVLNTFTSLAASLPGKYLRVAARYQQDGSLVAVRLWTSSSFNKVWVSPEGHVLHVDTSNPSLPVITVENEGGTGTALTVNGQTQFFFRAPESASGDAQPIATGPSFVTGGNLVRGFKVHAGVVDPLATPLVAQSVDIEIARYDGSISAPGSSHFIYDRAFHYNPGDGYSKILPYLSAATPNGKDDDGNAITGFKWWAFAYPTLLHSGTTAVADFVTATSGSADFGGSTSPVLPWGMSGCRWDDPAAPGAWSARWSVLMPVPLPKGSVQVPWASTGTGGTFGMTIPGGANTVPVDLATASGSATLVYEVNKDVSGIVTVITHDLTSAAGLAATVQALGGTSTPVRVYGIPASSRITAYALIYFTGVLPNG